MDQKQNCWEFKKCGRQPGGENVGKDGLCPAAEFELADGFCGGKNGGRACAYVVGTLCAADVCDIYQNKNNKCAECEFYLALKKEHESEMSLLNFKVYIEKKKNQPE
jgi:hypothetical protein